MMVSLSRTAFEGSLNTTFCIEPNCCLELVEIRQGLQTPGYDSYSLLFRGRTGEVLPQRTYHFTHSSLGEFDMFIVPVHRDGSDVTYEAVFNCRKEEADT